MFFRVLKNPPFEPPKLKPVITTLVLFAGTVRSDGKTNELNLPKNSDGANLQLNLESQDYKLNQAEIIDADSKTIWRNGKIKAKKAKVNTFVPSKNLTKGDYLIKPYGQNHAKQGEYVADYQFRVNLK
jgi:hypothetical protein